MRAKFVYEKFTEEGDPIKDMGIGTEYYMVKTHPIVRELKEMGLIFTSTENDIIKKKTLRFEATKELPNNVREVSFNMSPDGYFRINGKPKTKFKNAQTLDFALEYVKDNLFMKGIKLYKSEKFKIKDIIDKFENKKDFEKYVKNKFKDKVIIGNFRILRKKSHGSPYWEDMGRDIVLGKDDKMEFDYTHNKIVFKLDFYKSSIIEYDMLPTRTYTLREKEIGI